jgi:uncharacterized protein
LALFYLETSALAKLYVREPGTDVLVQLASRANNHQFSVLALSPIEFRSAIRKRERLHDLTADVAADVLKRFERHLQTRYVRQLVNDSVLDIASRLIDSHVLRAYDSIQLAGCLALRQASGHNEPIFACSDKDLLRAAGAEGLQLLDPVP